MKSIGKPVLELWSGMWQWQWKLTENILLYLKYDGGIIKGVQMKLDH
jgi:hypothetical protein